MTLLSVHQKRQAIDNLLKLAGQYSAGSPTNRDLTHYACIRICGFLETALQDIYYEYARKTGSPNTARFVSKRLARNATPWAGNIETLAEQFNPEWKDELTKLLNSNSRREAINSLVGNRIPIAHGRSSTAGLVQIQQWYRAVIDLIDLIESQTKV